MRTISQAFRPLAAGGMGRTVLADCWLRRRGADAPLRCGRTAERAFGELSRLACDLLDGCALQAR